MKTIDRQKQLQGILLLVAALVLGFFTIWDFAWKGPLLSMGFLLGYIMTGVPGVIAILEATDNLPDFYVSEINDEEED